MSLLLTVDDTLDALVSIAKSRGTAMYGVHPVCVDVEIVRDEVRWYLDGDKASRSQVVQAIEQARAARALPGYERRVQSIAQERS